MPDQNAKLSLNPLFKQQLSLLQVIAKSEFNIHISLDKMAQDKQYRETVFNELSELGDETLTKQVHVLRRVPVYIKPASEKPTAEPFMLDALPSPPQTTTKERSRVVVTEKVAIKRSRLSLMAFSALFFISLAVFAAWQNGYLYIALTPDTPLSALPLIAKKSPVIDSRAIETAVAAPKNELPSQPILTLPSDDKIVSLRLHGSNTVGESLAPALLEAYLKSKGINEMVWVQGKAQVERELQYIQGDHVYAIELHAHGSSTGFEDILNSQADMAMSSRKIKDKEVQLLRPLYGDLGLSGQEYIIGLDGLAVIVNPNNPIAHLSSETLAKIFAGEIDNWSEVGGADLKIAIYARDQNSGTWDTFNSLVLEANGKQLVSSARRYESSSELSEEVAKDIAAIGFIGLPYVNNSKAIAISASDNTMPIYPTRFTVSTEDYPLARRLYVYAPSVGNKMVKDLANFITSYAGQDIVEQVGLISQNIKLESIYKVKNAPQIYNDYTEVAKRLSVNFRFETNSNEIDNKGKHDLLRLVDFMADNQGRRIVLMGFSDAQGDPQKNMHLSLLRANFIERALVERGLNVIAVEGFGQQLPIASNHNALGRSKNRRVEVWFF